MKFAVWIGMLGILLGKASAAEITADVLASPTLARKFLLQHSHSGKTLSHFFSKVASWESGFLMGEASYPFPPERVAEKRYAIKEVFWEFASEEPELASPALMDLAAALIDLRASPGKFAARRAGVLGYFRGAEAWMTPIDRWLSKAGVYDNSTEMGFLGVSLDEPWAVDQALYGQDETLQHWALTWWKVFPSHYLQSDPKALVQAWRLSLESQDGGPQLAFLSKVLAHPWLTLDAETREAMGQRLGNLLARDPEGAEQRTRSAAESVEILNLSHEGLQIQVLQTLESGSLLENPLWLEPLWRYLENTQVVSRQVIGRLHQISPEHAAFARLVQVLSRPEGCLPLFIPDAEL